MTCRRQLWKGQLYGKLRSTEKGVRLCAEEKLATLLRSLSAHRKGVKVTAVFVKVEIFHAPVASGNCYAYNKWLVNGSQR